MSTYSGVGHSRSDASASWPMPPYAYNNVQVEAARLQGEAVANLLVGAARGLKKVALWIWQSTGSWRRYRRTYDELTSLDARMLADIGINRTEIEQIARGAWVPYGRDGTPLSRGASSVSNLDEHRRAA